MKIKSAPFEVLLDNPFANDTLNRQESAQILTELISSVDEPFVLAIDAGWGHGKTTFIRQWSAMLKVRGFQTLSFNAWENDFASDPLISFIGEMRTNLVIVDAEQKGAHSELKRKLDITKAIGAKILKRSLPVAAKIATFGALDLDEVTEEALAEVVSEFVDKEIESYTEDKNTLESFRNNLEDFINLITKESRNPLVFFIDELDRCRPTYAIELLERLKHLFSVRGIVFILALDKEQIAHSICSMYGINFDAHGYLRRFIDLDYKLPDSSGDGFTKFLIRSYGFDEYFGREPKHRLSIDSLVKAVTHIAKAFLLGLRDQEQLFSKLSVIFRTTPAHENLFLPVLLFLLVVKQVVPEKYLAISQGGMSQENILALIPSTVDGRALKSSVFGHFLAAYILYGMADSDALSQELHNLESMRSSSALSPEQRKEYQNSQRAIMEIVNADAYPLIPRLIQKIELSDRFIT